MINKDLYEDAARRFRDVFGESHTVAAYAPGRVEVLGNHTDYNEGLVLSAAINMGTFFLAAPSADAGCRLVAGDLMKPVDFDATDASVAETDTWSNYVRGVWSLLHGGTATTGFRGLFLSNIPMGAGLSSSAALEISAGLALGQLLGVDVPPLDLAKIGQKAEHDFAGVRCGLLDQISSLFGQAHQLVLTDFRSLDVETVSAGDDACFLVCDTKAEHALVDGEYNERRESCETAATEFAAILPHPVAALRDVSWEELEQHRGSVSDLPAKRAAHVIGENRRVLEGRKLLAAGDLAGFGRLMFESHQSSIDNFENSCPELDTLVKGAQGMPPVLGARLSGGGFGGSVVALVHARDVEVVSQSMSAVFTAEYGRPCDCRVIQPSEGAALVTV